MPLVPPTEIRTWWIYKITSPTGRVYIGITSNYKKRMSCYTESIKATRQTAIFASLRKYGRAAHAFDIIETFDNTCTYASGREIFWIRSYMSNKCKYPAQNGLNLTNGGDGTKGYKASAEAREKNRIAKTGKKQSPETKRKMSLARIGKKMNFTHYTPEFLKAASEKAKKYRHTDDAKNRIGLAAKGNKYCLGQKRTQEEKDHLSKLNKGKRLSPENLKAHTERVRKACGKEILQYDMSGNLLNEYPMIVTAAMQIGIPRLGICRNLSGQCKQSRGFIFKYKQDAINA